MRSSVLRAKAGNVYSADMNVKSVWYKKEESQCLLGIRVCCQAVRRYTAARGIQNRPRQKMNAPLPRHYAVVTMRYAELNGDIENRTRQVIEYE